MKINTAKFNQVVAEAMEELYGVIDTRNNWEIDRANEDEYLASLDEYFASLYEYDEDAWSRDEDAWSDEALMNAERRENATHEGEYVVFNSEGEELAHVHAMGIDDAEYQAYEMFGTAFIGGGVSCKEQDCWSCTMVFRAWQWEDENVTEEEVVTYCKALAYARANFHKVVYPSYDEDYEPCISVECCEEGKEYILRNGGRLAQKYMGR